MSTIHQHYSHLCLFDGIPFCVYIILFHFNETKYYSNIQNQCLGSMFHYPIPVSKLFSRIMFSTYFKQTIINKVASPSLSINRY